MTPVELFEKDTRDLAWVAEVLEYDANHGAGLSDFELLDLAGVIRSKLPTPRLAEPTKPGAMVCDKNGAYYVRICLSWYLMSGTELLEVPWESILNPTLHFEGYTVVG